MKKILTLLMILSFGFFGCSDDEPNSNSEINFDDLCIVTGVNFYDPNGSPVGQVGNPNIKFDGSFVYPIPGDGNIFVQSQKTVDKYWVIPAEKNTDFANINYDALEISYSESELDSKAVVSQDISVNLIALDLTMLPKGYYRILFKTLDGSYGWENFYLDSTKNGNEILDFLFSDWN